MGDRPASERSLAVAVRGGGGGGKRRGRGRGLLVSGVCNFISIPSPRLLHALHTARRGGIRKEKDGFLFRRREMGRKIIPGISGKGREGDGRRPNSHRD